MCLYKTIIFSCFIGLTCLVHPTNAIKFAVIGDFGSEGEGSKRVSHLVQRWNPDFIITTGDNNYSKTPKEDFHKNVSQYYGEYIAETIEDNRFWPCLGNHDFYENKGAQPYFDCFPALKNPALKSPDPDRPFCYKLEKENVDLFFVCSEKKKWGDFETQQQWLEAEIKASQVPWKIVVYHHPTYSSPCLKPGGGEWPEELIEENGEKEISPPFSEWGGVTAVLSGHLHHYERIVTAGTHYITNGLGGDDAFSTFKGEPAQGSVSRFGGENGALCVEAEEREISFLFQTVSGERVDRFTLEKSFEGRDSS